jgi:hypothetical protein
MTKRARFDGPDPEIQVYDPEGSVYDPPIATVKQGGHLPEDVPARIRQELVARENWTEVNYTPPGDKKKDGEQ